MKYTLLFAALLLSVSVCAEIKVVDDQSRTVMLAQPATRVISLSPHVTELLYAAGASNQVVAGVSFSDYPPQAKLLPQVGSYNKFDMETILSLKPDLIIGWQSGNPKSQLNELIALGLNVYITEPREFEDIAKDIQQIGQMLGTQKTADLVAQKYLNELQAIRQQYAGRKSVRVFYQVWNNPLFTVNGDHLISKVIRLCGGENVFDDLNVLAPQVSIEAVMAKNPDAIIIGTHETREDWADTWQKWPNIKAVSNHHVLGIDSDLIVRHTPRILLGARQMCEHLERVRADTITHN